MIEYVSLSIWSSWRKTVPYEISFSGPDEIIQIRVWGLVTKDEYDAVLKRVRLLRVQQSCKRFLANASEIRTRGIISTTAAFNFGVNLARGAADGDIRVALVLPTDLPSIIDVQFVAGVAARHGLLIDAFPTPEDARAWLIRDPKDG
jgi:hypothetical protein